ncbi:MAG: hypothetical protein V4706_01625 [Pseudomonadota bacterium]
MTTALAASLALSLVASFNQSSDVGSVNQDVKFTPNYVFTDGTGANQARILFSDTRTLAASANENLDLAGVLTDVFGNVLTFDKIKAIIVTAAAANTNTVVFGGAASAQAAPWFGDVADTNVIRPGGLLAMVAPDANGFDVTATTADLLKIANGGAGTPVTYTIVLIGV